MTVLLVLLIEVGLFIIVVVLVLMIANNRFLFPIGHLGTLISPLSNVVFGVEIQRHVHLSGHNYCFRHVIFRQDSRFMYLYVVCLCVLYRWSVLST